MDIGDILDRAAIGARLHATDKRQALQLASDLLGRTLGMPVTAVAAALSGREATGSTGLGHGVAAPHASMPGLQRVRAAFLRLEKPVPWGAVDGQPVDLVLALLSPEGAAPDHLRALARVSRTFRDAGLRDQLRRARTADTLHALLAQEGRAVSAA